MKSTVPGFSYSKCEIHYKRRFDLFPCCAFTKGNISVVVVLKVCTASPASILIKAVPI